VKRTTLGKCVSAGSPVPRWLLHSLFNGYRFAALMTEDDVHRVKFRELISEPAKRADDAENIASAISHSSRGFWFTFDCRAEDRFPAFFTELSNHVRGYVVIGSAV
jgi:hypothetical protein